MDEDNEELLEEMYVKIETIMHHGDPSVREMLRDLIREFHNQTREDPKSRASMKERSKELNRLGEKIINLPWVRQHAGEPASHASPETADTVSPKTGIIYAFSLVVLAGLGFAAWQVIQTTAEGQRPPTRVCDIKGNINIDGEKIYHLPGSEWYAKTLVEKGKGERWFCSEGAAQAAGWRQSISGP